MFWRKKHKAEPRDLTGWTFDVVNYPAGTKNYQVSIDNPMGEPLFVISYGFPSTTLHMKGKTKEEVLDKAKQQVYDMLEREEISAKNSTNITF